MSFWRSDKFKSLYKCEQTFEFFRSAKGHQLNIQKHDLQQNENIKNIKVKDPATGILIVRDAVVLTNLLHQ